MQLREYQQEAVDAVYRHLRERDDNPVVVCPTGSGKSLVIAQIASDAVRRWNGRVLVLAHVQELLEQNADKIRRLCPDVKVGIYSAGLKQRDTDSPIICAGIQSVYRRACELDAFDLIVVDECLPEGTPVSTPRGDVAIEDLYIGQPVHTALGVGTVEAISSRITTTLIEFEIEDGTVIRCTPNHPFFTAGGWAEAKALAVGSRVFRREEVSAMRRSLSAESLRASQSDPAALYVRGRVEGQEILLATMCGARKEEADPKGETSSDMEQIRRVSGSQELPLLRSRIPAVDQTGRYGECDSLHARITVEEAAILFDLLLKEGRKPDVAGRYSAESQQHPEGEGARSSSSRRQWRTDDQPKGSAHETWRRMGSRILSHDGQCASTTTAQTSEDRLGESQLQTGNRARRADACSTCNSASGQEENAIPALQRVVRVKAIQCDSAVPVFNLQINGHPSYYAHGFLSHNCHLISHEGDGMYRQFLADAQVINPQLRTIGLTATPFRLKSGMICSPDHFLNHVCYEIGIRELIRDGYLCPLVSKAGRTKAYTDSVAVRAGEFVAGELESLMNRDALVEAACSEIIERTANRNACLIFASGVEHGKHIARILRDKHNVECGFVCGETPAAEREELLARFRGDTAGTLSGREPLKYLCNVNVLTTGFDATNIDCIALLRPTMSPGLLVQMIGRALRLHADKQDALILDFAGNIERHGPIDQIRVKEKTGDGSGSAPAKECPECRSIVATGYATCPDCGFAFPPPERQEHDAEASTSSVLSGEVTLTVHDVQDVTYYVHTKRGGSEDAPKTMRVEYQIGLNSFVSEWVCFEHIGYARRKAEAWWRQRSPDPIPATAERAVELAEAGALAATLAITVRSVSGEPYDRIVEYELGELPEPVGIDICDSSGDLDELPF